MFIESSYRSCVTHSFFWKSPKLQTHFTLAHHDHSLSNNECVLFLKYTYRWTFHNLYYTFQPEMPGGHLFPIFRIAQFCILLHSIPTLLFLPSLPLISLNPTIESYVVSSIDGRCEISNISGQENVVTAWHVATNLLSIFKYPKSEFSRPTLMLIALNFAPYLMNFRISHYNISNPHLLDNNEKSIPFFPRTNCVLSAGKVSIRRCNADYWYRRCAYPSFKSTHTIFSRYKPDTKQ